MRCVIQLTVLGLCAVLKRCSASVGQRGRRRGVREHCPRRAAGGARRTARRRCGRRLRPGAGPAPARRRLSVVSVPSRRSRGTVDVSL